MAKNDFDEAMLGICRKADRELAIKFRNFLDKTVTLGGLGAAKYFLSDPSKAASQLCGNIAGLI